MATTFKVPTIACKRCNHSWIPRKARVVQCPKCKSALWDREKEKAS